MRTKKIVTIILALVLLMQSLLPVISLAVVETEEGGTTQSIFKQIVLADANLYKALKNILGNKASYNNATNTITITTTEINSITQLDLNNSNINDISGIEEFSQLKELELSGNNLTVESNLNKLNNLSKLTSVDLSTNKIKSFESIAEIVNQGKAILTNQIVSDVEIVRANVNAHQTTANYQLPQLITYLNEEDEIEIKLAKTNDNLSCKEYIEEGNNNIELKIGKFDNTYTLYEGKFNLEITIKSGKLKDSVIKAAYVVINGEEDEGIIFKDKNLYNAIKEQINNNVNYDYKNAYDDELVLVINKNVLYNDITELDVNNKQIKDLTGIEYFVGVTSLDLSENYIEKVNQLIELQENKEVVRTAIIAKLQAKIDKLKELNAKLKEYKEELKALVGFETTIGTIETRKK